MDKIELGLYFCSDPGCILHVCPGDPGVNGEGNWAVLPCGAMIGRGIYESRYYCDRCGTGRIGTRSGVSSRAPFGDSAQLYDRPVRRDMKRPRRDGTDAQDAIGPSA